MNKKQFFKLLSSMPPLHHTLPGQQFDAEKSEPVAWFMAQPGFKNWVFARMAATERIAYDPSTGKWSGVNRGPAGRPKTPA